MPVLDRLFFQQGVNVTNRVESVAAFVAIAQRLFQSELLPPGGREVAALVFERLRIPSDDGVRHSTRYPACEWLNTALAPVIGENTEFGAAARAIKTLEPTPGWSPRTTGQHGSPDFIDGHVHGMICGPGGAESRYDVQPGFSLMVPNTRYPDHSHPPEEAHVLFTRGEFRQKDGEWFDPGLSEEYTMSHTDCMQCDPVTRRFSPSGVF
ncbi:dimethylsulfonioproprionate lyase family protein [Paraburkholderia sp. HD33-4]|uniref:dimethylsulfonioproprionate lyase family protein n=1 Tax=Paraburkholderia sp. HD33-4 TaxID=2883242 RepID=UPI001F447456|nr:dimethylsulfonioproprionate lyase family protein [Paraburkholderia sp. HD33-4]